MSTSEATSSSDARRPIPRRSHKKSKVGCRTCRIRKVKCDERRPLCANCERHYTNLLACDFDNQDPVFDHGVSWEHRRARDAAVPNSSQPRRPRTAQVRTSRVGRQAEELAIPPTVAQGLIDPFEARPASQEPAPNVDVLMGHYLAHLAYRCFPFYACRALIELWWPFVRSDALLFNVVLLLSSLDLSRQRDQHDALQTQKLLDQCLTLLSRRIQDAVASVSDHTVVAVATLAVIEHDRGNVRALKTHGEGLKRIVELRGGLDAIRQTNPMAANLVFWCALVGMDEPHILPLTYSSQEDRTSTRLSGLESTTLRTHDGGVADLLAFGVDAVTASILHEVQRLSKLYISVLDSPSPEQGITVLSSLCLIVQHLLQSSQSESHDSPTPGLSRSCRLAGCLHIFAPLSGYFPDPTLLLHTLTTDLKTALTRFLHAAGTNSHLLLWLLAVGGITAHAMPAERLWYISHLVVVTADLGIASWAQMRRHLVALAFHDNFCDVSFRALWQEVWRRREALLVGGPDERALVSGNEGGL